jgi:hypothetical protein
MNSGQSNVHTIWYGHWTALSSYGEPLVLLSTQLANQAAMSRCEG